MKYILLTLLLIAGKLGAQGAWVQIDQFHFGVTSLTFDIAGNKFLSLQQGYLVTDLPDGTNDTIQTYPVLWQNEAGFITVLIDSEDVYLYLMSPDTVARVLHYHSGNQFYDTLLEVKYTEPQFTPPFFGAQIGGGLCLANDTMLYVGFGMGINKNNSQDLGSLRGKLVAYNLNNNSSYIAARGLRNAWRLAFDYDNNEVWISDVGSSIAEEVDVFNIDQDTLINYGWPCFENDVELVDTCEQENVLPVYWYHQDPHRAITGGCIYNGEYYWCDNITGMGGHILQTDSVWVNTPLLFPKDITGMAVNPADGNLYACAWGGRVYEFFPDTTILALPDDTIHSEYIPIDWSIEWIQSLIDEFGEVWIAMDGTIYYSRPTIPAFYLRAIMDKNGVILKQWILIPK